MGKALVAAALGYAALGKRIIGKHAVCAANPTCCLPTVQRMASQQMTNLG